MAPGVLLLLSSCEYHWVLLCPVHLWVSSFFFLIAFHHSLLKNNEEPALFYTGSWGQQNFATAPPLLLLRFLLDSLCRREHHHSLKPSCTLLISQLPLSLSFITVENPSELEGHPPASLLLQHSPIPVLRRLWLDKFILLACMLASSAFFPLWSPP